MSSSATMSSQSLQHRTQSRGVHTTSSARANVVAAPSMSSGPIDIFDVPHMLGESRYSSVERSSTPFASQRAPASATKSGRFVAPLPAPILFDGPARPKNPPPTISRAGLRTSATAHLTGPAGSTVQCYPPASEQPRVEMFDGPARQRRPAYVPRPISGPHANAARKPLVLLGLAGAAYGVATASGSGVVLATSL